MVKGPPTTTSRGFSGVAFGLPPQSSRCRVRVATMSSMRPDAGMARLLAPPPPNRDPRKARQPGDRQLARARAPVSSGTVSFRPCTSVVTMFPPQIQGTDARLDPDISFIDAVCPEFIVEDHGIGRIQPFDAEARGIDRERRASPPSRAAPVR